MQQDSKEFVVNQHNSFINQYNSFAFETKFAKIRRRARMIPLPPRQKRRHAMSLLIRSSIISRLFNAVAALSLCGSTAAWAATGGSDQGTVNSAWQTFCKTTLPSFGIVLPSCPVVPSVTQGILQLAASQQAPPVVVRSNSGPSGSLAPLGQAVDAIDPSLPMALIPVPNSTESFTAITKFPIPAKSTTTKPLVLGLSDLLPAMTPLAFISSSKGPAPAAQLYDRSANVFLYGVASEFTGQSGSEPDTVFFAYDDTSLTNGNLKQGSVVAEFSFPLVVLTGYAPPPAPSGTETLVPTTLQFRATTAGDCSASTVSGQSLDGTLTTPPSVSFSLFASQIGIDCAVVFAPSPLSTASHAIFEVRVPLIVTLATDPQYIGSNLYNVIASPWSSDVTGFPQTPPGGFSGVKGIPDGSFIGLAPSAQPLLPQGSPNPTGAIPYALCANLPGGNGNGQAPVPSVATFYAIANDGATLLSAPTPAAFAPISGQPKPVPPVCPF
jgi:hypothetical protein